MHCEYHRMLFFCFNWSACEGQPHLTSALSDLSAACVYVEWNPFHCTICCIAVVWYTVSSGMWNTRYIKNIENMAVKQVWTGQKGRIYGLKSRCGPIIYKMWHEEQAWTGELVWSGEHWMSRCWLVIILDVTWRASWDWWTAWACWMLTGQHGHKLTD